MLALRRDQQNYVSAGISTQRVPSSALINGRDQDVHDEDVGLGHQRGLRSVDTSQLYILLVAVLKPYLHKVAILVMQDEQVKCT